MEIGLHFYEFLLISTMRFRNVELIYPRLDLKVKSSERIFSVLSRSFMCDVYTYVIW